MCKVTSTLPHAYIKSHLSKIVEHMLFTDSVIAASKMQHHTSYKQHLTEVVQLPIKIEKIWAVSTEVLRKRQAKLFM